MLIKIIFILLGSAVITAVSWRSLKNPRSHGFYRFFAFETLLVMFAQNAPAWFDAPLSPHQQVSWIFMIASLILIIHSLDLILILGLSEGSIPQSPNLPFENTTRLVVVGAYRFIRHPMYASVILLTWGVAMKEPSVRSLCLSVVVMVLLYVTARVEERENIERFGEEYRQYMKKSRMFIPFIF